jgi:glyoxylase-like metal-dependent hydrolase (beta-lactamase superfamily II)
MHKTVSYELFALKYAINKRRTTRDAFLVTHDLHDALLPLEFSVWVAHAQGRVILIDGGSDKEVCRARGHDFIRCPAESLSLLGFSAEQVTDVIVTHMHWDHLGNLDKFPSARIHVYPTEIAHACGPAMCHPTLRRPYEVGQVCSLVQALYKGRVFFTDTGSEIAPGITVHHMGGHTPGLQVARVNTARGPVVVASDAMHYYDNARLGNPYPVLVDVKEYLNSSQAIYTLASTPDHVVAGHDPRVFQIYPAPSDELRDIAVRLDASPRLD